MSDPGLIYDRGSTDLMCVNEIKEVVGVQA